MGIYLSEVSGVASQPPERNRSGGEKRKEWLSRRGAEQSLERGLTEGPPPTGLNRSRLEPK